MRPPHRFSWIHENLVGGMAYPSSLQDIIYLRDNNVGTIITLTEAPLNQNLQVEGINFVNIPIPDFCPPTQDQIKFAVSTIEQTIPSKSVVVHCLGGSGRTGTILACWISKFHKMSGEEAIKEIRKHRPSSIENQEQEESVITYSKSLNY